MAGSRHKTSARLCNFSDRHSPCVTVQTVFASSLIFLRIFTSNNHRTGIQMKRSILLSAAMVIATSAPSAYAEKEEKVRWSQLPAAVQKTITDNAGDGKIE